MNISLENNDITKKQPDLAYLEAEKLIKYIECNKSELLRLSKKYLDFV